MRTLSIIAAFAVSLMTWTHFGCGGSGIPNVEGSYALTNVTNACADFFPPDVNVTQNDDQIVVEAVQPGFADIAGTIDEDGNIDVEGTAANGLQVDCAGTIIDGVAVGDCDVSDSTGTVSCSATYEK